MHINFMINDSPSIRVDGMKLKISRKDFFVHHRQVPSLDPRCQVFENIYKDLFHVHYMTIRA